MPLYGYGALSHSIQALRLRDQLHARGSSPPILTVVSRALVVKLP